MASRPTLTLDEIDPRLALIAKSIVSNANRPKCIIPPPPMLGGGGMVPDVSWGMIPDASWGMVSDVG